MLISLGTTTFENREFSFTLKDDIYIRYMSFLDATELDKELQKRVPYKIDIGAVYNHKVCKKISISYFRCLKFVR